MDPVEIKPIPEWLVLLDQLEEQPGLVFLLGSTHTGKSTLARFLRRQEADGNPSATHPFQGPNQKS